MKLSHVGIKKLVAMMRDQGVASFKLGDLAVEFTPPKSAVVLPMNKPKTTEDRQRELDRVLFHSANGA